MFVRLVVLWLFIAAGLWISSRSLPGVRFTSPLSLLGGALVLGILDATAGPVLLIATFPFTVITLGLFVFVVNAVVLMLAAWLVPGFEVDGPVPALFAGAIVAAHAFAGYLFGIWLVTGHAQLASLWALAPHRRPHRRRASLPASPRPFGK